MHVYLSSRNRHNYVAVPASTVVPLSGPTLFQLFHWVIPMKWWATWACYIVLSWRDSFQRETLALSKGTASETDSLCQSLVLALFPDAGTPEKKVHCLCISAAENRCNYVAVPASLYKVTYKVIDQIVCLFAGRISDQVCCLSRASVSYPRWSLSKQELIYVFASASRQHSYGTMLNRLTFWQ